MNMKHGKFGWIFRQLHMVPLFFRELRTPKAFAHALTVAGFVAICPVPCFWATSISPLAIQRTDQLVETIA